LAHVPVILSHSSKPPSFLQHITSNTLPPLQSATTAALFGGVAGFAALFFFAEVPKVRTDIMMKIPVIGDYFVKDIAPEDNPF